MEVNEQSSDMSKITDLYRITKTWPYTRPIGHDNYMVYSNLKMRYESSSLEILAFRVMSGFFDHPCGSRK